MPNLCLVQFSNNKLQQGFTLLELVLVLFLIGLLASAGLLFTENIESQAQYEDTQKRITLIRRAIVGDVNRTVNGSPELSGFVADVGRLPLCIRELVELGVALGGGLYRSPCDDEPEFDLTLWQIDPATGVGAGWRGPYLQASMEKDEQRRFRDGYGNGNNPLDINDGWRWSLANGLSDADIVDLSQPSSAVNVRYLHLKSDGFDIDLTTDDVPADGNEFLVADDWLYPDGNSNNANIRVNFKLDNSLSNTNIDVQATLSRPEVNSSFFSMPLSSTAISLASSGVNFHSENIEFNQSIPLGRYLFKLSCSSSCVPDNYLITILPRQTLVPLEFQIIP